MNKLTEDMIEEMHRRHQPQNRYWYGFVAGAIAISMFWAVLFHVFVLPLI